MEQERQKREVDETEFQSPNMPILCANNCGFFGSPATNNLCSKCYRDYFSNKAKAAMETLVVPPPAAEAKEVEEKPSADEESAKVAILSEEGGASSNEAQAPAKKNPGRCGFCNKRVGLMGFKCRCGEVFCPLHRYSDKHDCSYDYKGEAQDAISKANPVIKADKIDKI